MRDWLRRIAACSAIVFSSLAAAQAEPLDVVATFSIIGDFAAEVGGDRIRLNVLVGPDSDTHVHEPRPADAIALANHRAFGNQACLFTTSGAAARAFRHQVKAGNVGINLGIAAPMAYYPFSGWDDSFFGDLHGQGQHAVEFFTQTKVVVERWPSTWSRRF